MIAWLSEYRRWRRMGRPVRHAASLANFYAPRPWRSTIVFLIGAAALCAALYSKGAETDEIGSGNIEAALVSCLNGHGMTINKELWYCQRRHADIEKAWPKGQRP